MKKLIVLIVLFPMFSFSQMLLENVKKQCLSEKSTNTYDCFETLNDSKIYIDNDKIVFDVKVSKEVYEIIDSYIVDNGDVFYTVKKDGFKFTIFKHHFEDGDIVVYIMGKNSSLIYR